MVFVKEGENYLTPYEWSGGFRISSFTNEKRRKMVSEGKAEIFDPFAKETVPLKKVTRKA